jgi:hypothetical protein
MAVFKSTVAEGTSAAAARFEGGRRWSCPFTVDEGLCSEPGLNLLLLINVLRTLDLGRSLNIHGIGNYGEFWCYMRRLATRRICSEDCFLRGSSLEV